MRTVRVLLTGLLAVAAIALPAGCDRTANSATGDHSRRPSRPATSPATHSPTPSPSPSPSPVSYPLRGTGSYAIAPGHSATLGRSGTLLRFQVAVEHGIDHLSVSGFADQVVDILGDPQGWTAGGDWRLRRVGPGQPHDFVIYLATPATRDVLCGAVNDRYTSCRNGDAVVINVSRWLHGVPYYHDLTAYRDYALSHEVGHRLGHGHELCPGKGKPAPTMEQQTLGLHGCTPNPWPYPHGHRYAGPAGEYPLIVPTDPTTWYRPS
ncbi:DUF3152 domain-containing protein [Actinocatenispora comari]|uniref:DUF3152 domain-containing protein n=1 Tax=Actinocatenispora comari TaxID=2807577 RepID=A0A8J4AB39_9ACTN|nr:DUF3152 domain-containing protein [Actinocatenispora comari]GIL27109.1 hypothetical protein NUM_23630 [Actinocatenispora comari]